MLAPTAVQRWMVMGMARLIDADALGIGKAKREAFDNPAYADGWNSAIAIIEDAPTIDAVPVVRCKDCEFALSHPDNAEKLVCRKGINWRGVEPNHYCSYGERRTDNDG